MSRPLKLDMSKFKKVSSDKHHTIMRHEDGHEMKIAHSALSPKLRGELAEIPTAMADGGMASENSDIISDDPQADRAGQGFKKIAKEAPAYISNNLKKQQSMIDAAQSGDQQAQRQMIEGQLQSGMGSIAPVAGAIGEAASSEMAPMMKILQNNANVLEARAKNAEYILGRRGGSLADQVYQDKAIQARQAADAAQQHLASMMQKPKMADGGEIKKPQPKPSPTPSPWQKNAQDFQKGFNQPETLSEMGGNIKKAIGFAEGGEADSPEKIAADAAAQAPQPQIPAININVNGQPQGQAEKMGNAYEQAYNAPPQQVQIPKDSVGAAYANAYNANLGPNALPAQQPQQAPQMAPAQPQEQPQAQPQQASPGIAPQQPQSGLNLSQSDPMGLNAQYDASMSGMAKEQAGIQGIANAQQAQAQAEAQAYRKQAEVNQALIADYNSRYKDINNHFQAVADGMADQTIDPNRFWNNKSTVGKISTVIGMILGGGGAGTLHQENLAYRSLQNNIERDIDAQKAEMGKKHNLLNAYHQKFGDLKDATDMLRVTLNDSVANQIKLAAAQQGGPMAQANARMLLGKLEEQKASLISQTAQRQTMMRALSNSSPDQMGQTMNALRMTNPEMAKEMEQRYVPGVGMAQIPVPQDIRGKIAASKHLDQQLGELEQFSRQHSGSLDPATVAKGRALASQVQDAYRQANAQGVFKESEAKFVERSVNQDPTAFFSNYRTLPGYQVTRKNNKDTLKYLYQSYGIPQAQEIPTGAPVPNR